MDVGSTTPLLAQETVARLREESCRGDSRLGTLMAEAAVARRLGMSRLPAREAPFSSERDGVVACSATERASVKQLTLATPEPTADSHREIRASFASAIPAISEKRMRRHFLGWREWLPFCS
ncbi:MAG: hypothetical protein WBE58_04255 [Verrucomicrobiales bacterium]|nr:hypothetical protein [Verrucomicrobiales bacterium]